VGPRRDVQLDPAEDLSRQPCLDGRAPGKEAGAVLAEPGEGRRGQDEVVAEWVDCERVDEALVQLLSIFDSPAQP
jgi:hypothetical protein